MKNKLIISYAALALVIATGVYLSVSSDKGQNEETQTAGTETGNVSVVDGKQIVEIRAKGGYLPRVSTAKAGIPTILRFDTAGTYDCSTAVSIPSMNLSKVLPPTGETDIDIGVQQVGIFRGSCGMGMYPFQVNFES